MKRHFLVLSVSVLALTACAHPPAYKSSAFKAASIKAAPVKPVQVVEVPKPLPLLGQLKKLPEKEKIEHKPPKERVVAANKAATKLPTQYGYINAIQVYPFTEGALYQLYASPEHVTDIMLQAGEKLTSVSAGDTVRWVVGDTVSGNGETSRTHVLVKPVATSLKTNLVITTDRRSYHLQMESTAKTYMAALSWAYPHDQLSFFHRKNAVAEAMQPVAQNLTLDKIQFRYEIKGDKPIWRPLRAFDDGKKVYIEFPRTIAQGEAPPLFLVGAGGDSELVNYHVRSNYYIVDRLFAAAELRLGKSPQKVVRITRTNDGEGW